MEGPKASTPEPGLSSRDLSVLRAVIQDYIEHAEPVGSRSLTRGHALGVSPATIRNVMADLEDLGYLQKPHTSAGRVPTGKAFRLYVDTLLRVRPLPSRARARVDRQYDPPPDDLSRLVQHTGRVLHRLTRWASVVATPRATIQAYREVRFIRLREDRVLAVLVTPAGLVQNRVLVVDWEVGQGELDRAGNYLSELLGSGRTLDEVRRRIEDDLAEDRAAVDRLARRALELGRRALADPEAQTPGEVVVEGTTSFLDLPEFADRDKMRALLSALEEKELLLGILERAEVGSGIQIFVGAESELAADDVSMVVATYGRREAVLGTLGVIGPTRMDYGRVIPFVEYTAELLSRTLEEAGS